MDTYIVVNPQFSEFGDLKSQRSEIQLIYSPPGPPNQGIRSYVLYAKIRDSKKVGEVVSYDKYIVTHQTLTNNLPFWD